MKTFLVVERKDKDLFTIYDTENKGVCCCSLYTLKDLIKQGVEVKGFLVQNGKVKIQELNLDGTVRQKKAPILCEDTTKRSASTILKGLDEKHYPRVKQNRKGILGNFVEGTVVIFSYKANGEDIQDKVGVVIPTNKGNEVYNLDGFVVPTDAILDIKEKKPDNNEKIFCDTVYKSFKERLTIEKTKLELENKIHRLIERYSKIDVDLSIAKNEYILNTYRQKTKGNEEFKQSKIKGPFNKDFVKAVIEKTKRPLIYTYGYTWKNPTTCRVPITKEQALNVVNKASLLDVTATKDNIHLNEFSGSDMW